MLAGLALAILWLLCGLTAVLTMLSMLVDGNIDNATRSALTWTHRIFGWRFSVGYPVFTFFSGEICFPSSALGATI
jgi:hypothetical protein